MEELRHIAPALTFLFFYFIYIFSSTLQKKKIKGGGYWSGVLWRRIHPGRCVRGDEPRLTYYQLRFPARETSADVCVQMIKVKSGRCAL